jgi:hypothetical protein
MNKKLLFSKTIVDKKKHFFIPHPEENNQNMQIKNRL